MTLASCAYEGTVVHSRRTPVAHTFRYRVFMLLLDLDEVDAVFGGRLLWSARRAAPVRWRREDHPGDPAVPLASWVRDLVAERTGVRPAGPVRLLTHPRYLGVGFNPISVYYCYAPDGTTLEWAVAEVTSTPWRERSHHVLDVRADVRAHRGLIHKDLHVSPFLPMDLDYRWRLTEPGASVSVGFDVVRGDELVLETGVGMRRRPLTTASRMRLLLGHPPMSLTVLGGIHWQAFRLWRKGVPYQPHPKRAEGERIAA